MEYLVSNPCLSSHSSCSKKTWYRCPLFQNRELFNKVVLSARESVENMILLFAAMSNNYCCIFMSGYSDGRGLLTAKQTGKTMTNSNVKPPLFHNLSICYHQLKDYHAVY